MKTSEALRKAFELLGENGEHWIQGRWAFDKYGNVPNDADPDTRPVRFCSWGALRWLRFNSINDEVWGQAATTLNYAVRKLGANYGYASYNDSHTWDEVKMMWVTAIALAEKEEGES